MDNFKNSYQKLLSLATAMVVNTKISLEPEELVNHAYMNLHDQPFDFSKYKKEMSTLAHTEKNRQHKLKELHAVQSYKDRVKQKYCGECKETLPLSAFTVGKVMCKTCRNKKEFINKHIDKPARFKKEKYGRIPAMTENERLLEFARMRQIINQARNKTA